jgi:hypothetical protein
MRLRRLIIGLLLCAAAAVLGLALRMTPPGYTRIHVVAEGAENPLFSAVVPDGERLTLFWRNSQFGLDVTEEFFTRGGILVQDRAAFAIPGGPPPPRVAARDVDDLFHTGGPFDARGLSRPLTRIVYRIGEIGNPRLCVQKRTIAFKEEAGFGGRVILTAKRPSLFEILIHP